ncbi:unnamed protein product, partial [Effrenium voratum]
MEWQRGPCHVVQRKARQPGSTWQMRGRFDPKELQNKPKHSLVQTVDRLRRDGLLSIKECSTAINALGRASAWPEALGLLCGLRSDSLEPSSITYGAALGAVPSWSICLSLIGQALQAGTPTGPIHITALIKSLSKGSDWARSMMAWQEVRDCSMLDPRLNSATITALRGERWTVAVWLLKEAMCSVPPDIVNFNAAISACEKGQQWEQALTLLDAAGGLRVQAETITFSGAISACEKCRQWERALAMLGQLKRSRLTADTIIYSAAISACEKSGRWQQAVLVLQQMLEERVPTDMVLYSAVMSACEKGRRWAEALYLLKEALRKFRPEITPYNVVISACAPGGQWEVAVQLLSEAADLGVDVRTASSAISACAEAKAWAPALAVLADMRQRSVRPNIKVLNAAVGACEAPGVALGLLQEIRSADLEPDILSYVAAIEAIADRGISSWRSAEAVACLVGTACALLGNTFSSVENLAGQLVLALDLLTDAGFFQAYGSALQAWSRESETHEFARRTLLAPAWPRLMGLTKRRSGEIGGGVGWELPQLAFWTCSALRDSVLERQFGLGNALTSR